MDYDAHHTTTILRRFFWDNPGKLVPEENFWTLWCKGRLTEADTPTMWLGATPSRLTSAHSAIWDKPRWLTNCCILNSHTSYITTTNTTTVLWPFFRDHTGELVPEKNFWTLWCNQQRQSTEGKHIIHQSNCIILLHYDVSKFCSFPQQYQGNMAHN